jgi:hypothetical protein
MLQAVKQIHYPLHRSPIQNLNGIHLRRNICCIIAKSAKILLTLLIHEPKLARIERAAHPPQRMLHQFRSKNKKSGAPHRQEEGLVYGPEIFA